MSSNQIARIIKYDKVKTLTEEARSSEVNILASPKSPASHDNFQR